MLCSANEVTALLRKACVGVGLPVGLAYDAAAAAVWLETRGAAGCQSLLDLLHNFDGAAEAVRHDSLLWRGPSMVDELVAQTAQSGAPRRPLQVDASLPLLFAGYVGVAADVHGVEYEASFDRTFSEQTGSPLDVSEPLWNAANALAARTYVPATEESRLKGAGAGLTDND